MHLLLKIIKALESLNKAVLVLFFINLIVLCGCESNSSQITSDNNISETLFELIPSSQSGINFQNTIQESEYLNYYTFRHMYIGAGVATGDFNNDGLEDVFMVGNMSGHKLYINEGDFKFKDITASAGVDGNTGFYMGVSVVDINNDGYLDIYLNKSGLYSDKKFLENELYVNNGDLTFTNRAKDFGLNDSNRSVQSTFFDYDKDGDLDLFLVNTPVDFRVSMQAIVLDYVYTNPNFKKLGGNDKLYRNDGGIFKDVTVAAGIKPDIGFGLSVSVADYNQDGYPDIYVANDFVAPDYLYINNKKGGFDEMGTKYFRHTSFYSMGSDVSDVNNDGLLDLMVMDMNPSDHVRSKTTMNMVDRKLFKTVVDAGYNNIYMHNMLHLNNGMGSFNEVANMTGMANTDWSWSVLISDLDLDGWKDVHITNGIYRDVLDRDNDFKNLRKENGEKITPKEMLDHLRKFPSEKISNYAFKNKSGLAFEDESASWGLDQKAFSNGTALADLDNDGDLDMIINNLMDTSLVYKNYAVERGNKFLKVQLKGSSKNPEGIGAVVSLISGYHEQTELVRRTRGYLSGSQPTVIFGVPDSIDNGTIEVVWPDGKVTTQKGIEFNKSIMVAYGASEVAEKNERKDHYFEEAKSLLMPPFKHEENQFDDYTKQVLLPYSYSRLGPFISTGDVNGDKLEDFYIGGAANQPGAVYLQNDEGKFIKKKSELLDADAAYEDMKSTFLDVDNDGDLDLYVSSGGYEYELGSSLLQDRLYLNDGEGNFNKKAPLPNLRTSNSVVISNDIDNDGDLDLFVGGRVTPGAYPYEPRSYLLINEGEEFVDKTDQLAPDLKYLGMVTDGTWFDLDGDNNKELVLVGEWMPITVFKYIDGSYNNVTKDYGLNDLTGWWQSIHIEKLKDGKIEVLAGNIGLNIKHKASNKKPFEVYASDFDNNETVDIILAKYYKDQQVPVRGKDCTTEQMPFIGEKFETFDAFAAADVNELLGDEISNAKNFKVNTFQSQRITIDSKGQTTLQMLPIEFQQAPLMSIEKYDINDDGLDDIIAAGNLFETEVETSRLDAGSGIMAIAEDSGYRPMASHESGLFLPYDVKNIRIINRPNDADILLIAVNNGSLVSKIMD